MGYQTDFSGQMNFSRQLTGSELDAFQKLAQYDTEEYLKYSPKDKQPESYQQWEPLEDGSGLAWNDAEKFYDYAEWLQWLIDYFFKPKGILLSGRIDYQGEEIGDVGYLEVKADQNVQVHSVNVDGLVECPECNHIFKAEEHTAEEE